MPPKCSLAVNGYVQNLVNTHLIALATEHDVTVRIERGTGQFVHAGETLALVWPAHKTSEAILDSLNSAYALDRQRTVSQDPMFLVNELIEIAARALSPGINDPFTAMTCMDWLRSTLVSMAATGTPSPYRHDEHGNLRLLLTPLTFTEMADIAFHSLRPYFCNDPNACAHMLNAIGRMAAQVGVEQRRLLLEHAQWLQRASEQALPDPADRARVKTSFETAQRKLQDSSSNR